MAEEKNIDAQATNNELNDEALNEANGGMDIHNHYVLWAIKCLDWECGAVDSPILPIGQMPERKCHVCGGRNVDVTPPLPLSVPLVGESLLNADGALRTASRAVRGLRLCKQGLQRKAVALNKVARQAHGVMTTLRQSSSRASKAR